MKVPPNGSLYLRGAGAGNFPSAVSASGVNNACCAGESPTSRCKRLLEGVNKFCCKDASFMRLLAIWKYFGSNSHPINCLPSFTEETPVVPEPINGSNTTGQE